MGLTASIEALFSTKKLFPPMTWDAHIDVVRRALLVLGKREAEEVDAVALYYDELLRQHLDDVEEVVSEVWESEGELAPTRFSIPRLLYIARDLVPLSPPKAIADITWAHIFAVVALRRFSHFLEAVQAHADRPEQERLVVPVGLISAYGDAVEAISLAETLATDETHDSLIKAQLKARFAQQQRDQTRAASASRHAATNRLLRELVAFYDNGNFASYRQAVTAFLDNTPEERVKHLAPSNRHRTLAEGLSAVKRGKRQLD